MNKRCFLNKLIWLVVIFSFFSVTNATAISNVKSVKTLKSTKCDSYINKNDRAYLVSKFSDFNFWAIQLPDNQIIGYHDDNRISGDDKASETCCYQPVVCGNSELSFDTNMIKIALNIVSKQWDGSKYLRHSHNSHDFVNAVIAEYRHLGGVVRYEPSLALAYVRLDD
jgi:hypothetical protein